MENKIYHLIMSDPWTNKIVEILNFHSLENAIARGKEFIKEDYDENNGLSLEESYEYWEETHSFFGMYEIAESEFEDKEDYE